jgi:hypothetical protein
MFVEDPEALNDLGMPNFYGKVKTPDDFMAAGIEFDPGSRYGNYNLADFQKLGIGSGARVTGINADTFLAIDNPTEDPKLGRQTTYSRSGADWKVSKQEFVRDQDFKLKDALKIAAPIFLGLVPGLGTGLAASFGGGLGGNIVAGAIRGGLTSGLSGGNIGKGLISGGLGAGIGGAIRPVFGNSVVGRAAAGAVTRAATAKATGGDSFSAAVMGAIGGANPGRSLGLEGATANFVNDLARITAQTQLAQRKRRGN